MIKRHAGKLILLLAVAIFAWTYYADELTPEVLACKDRGGKKLYGECWVPLKSLGR